MNEAQSSFNTLIDLHVESIQIRGVCNANFPIFILHTYKLREKLNELQQDLSLIHI